MEETNLISAHNGRNKPNISTQWKKQTQYQQTMEETNLTSANNGRNKPNISTQWKKQT